MSFMTLHNIWGGELSKRGIVLGIVNALNPIYNLSKKAEN